MGVALVTKCTMTYCRRGEGNVTNVVFVVYFAVKPFKQQYINIKEGVLCGLQRLL